MPKIEDLELTGASGNSYSFEVYPLDTRLTKHSGVFAITKRTKTSSGVDHTRIFIGETDRLRDIAQTHPSKPCFTAMGASCICVYGEEKQDQRAKIADDVLAGDSWACNQHPR